MQIERLNSPAFVYSWSDKATSKVYVGVHKGYEDDGYVCSSETMMHAYKERPHDFTRQIVAKGLLKDCIVLETKIIEQLLKDGNTCYNRSAWPMILFDKNIIEKMKAAWNNRRKTPVSQETRLKMSEVRKGVRKSQEHKKNIGAALSGKPKSKESIEKMRKALTGKPLSAETRAKIGAAHKGRKQTPDEIANRVASRKANKEAKRQEAQNGQD
jgi:hypothetical protein